MTDKRTRAPATEAQGRSVSNHKTPMKNPRIKTTYVPLHRGHRFGPIVHTATVTSDWRESDFIALGQAYPDTVFATANYTGGPRWLTHLKTLFRIRFL